MPKLSFIVTSYNYAQYLEECIDSILAQTYKNIEIIIVDDHSRDNSVEVCNSIIRRNNTGIKIKLIAHKSTKGLLSSIFDGIFASSGDFIACIASDDKISKDYALTHIAIHLFEPIALSVCELYEVDENSTITTLTQSNELPQTMDRQIIAKLKIKIKNLNIKSVIKILDRKTNFFGGWWWAPLSCAVFRKRTIQPFLNFDRLNNWRVAPEKILLNFLHLIGGSIKIYEPLVAYRKYGHNAGGIIPILGNIKYNTNYAKEAHITNQINLYKDIIHFFKKEKKSLINIYSKKEYNNLLKEIYLSIPKLIKLNLFR